jgi:hypothetical protein
VAGRVLVTCHGNRRGAYMLLKLKAFRMFFRGVGAILYIVPKTRFACTRRILT